MNTPTRAQYRLATFALLAMLHAHTLYAGANNSLNLAAASSQYVSVAASPSLTPTPLTFEAWVYPTTAKCNTIISRGDGGNANTDYIFQVGYNGTTCGVMNIGFFGAGAWDASTSTVPLNTWTHVAVTYDGTNKQFYINGVLDRTAARTGSLYQSGSAMYIGRQGASCNCNFFQGGLAEVRIWNTVRSSNQISADMNVSPSGSQPGLVAYYHLNEGGGVTANDASGNGNTGTLVNGPTWANSVPPVLGTSTRLEGPGAGMDSVVLAVTPATYTWTATTNAPWLHLSAANKSGTASTNVVFSFDANTGATRTGNLTIASRTLTVTQAGSNYVAAAPFTTLVAGSLSQPYGVALDGSGNVYIADYGNNAIKEWLAASNTVTTLPISGLNHPEGVAVDGAGNVYIADASNNVIKEWLAASNSVTALVTNGLNTPQGVALDAAGNVYFADYGNKAIKEWLAASNTVTTPTIYYINYPDGVAVDRAGNIYVGDYDVSELVEWTAANHNSGPLASYPDVNAPAGVAVDGAGNVYLADFYGNAVQEWSAASNTAPTLVSGLNGPFDVAVDGSGNVFVADTGNNAVEELPRAFVVPTPRWETTNAGSDSLPVVLPATENLLSPFAPSSSQPWLTITGVTNGVVSFSFTATPANRVAYISLLGQNIPVTQFDDLLGSSLVYVGPAAGTNNVTLTVNPAAPQAWTATSQASWLHVPVSSGSGSATVSFTIDPNPGATRTATLTIGGQTFIVIQEALTLGWNARAEGPGAGADSVVLSSLGAPWTATANASWLHLSAGNQSGTGNQNVVFTFDANTGITRTGTLTIAGMTLTITQGGSNYIAAQPVTTLVPSSQLSIPYGDAVDAAGNVYIADTQDHQLKKWSPANNSVSTLLSFGSSEYLDSVALDAAGNVFIASYYNDLVQEWSPASNTVTTLLSLGSSNPEGIAVDGADNVYVSDFGNGGNGVVKQLLAANQTVISLPNPQATSYPTGLALDAAGNAYFFDEALLEWPVGSQNLTTLVGGSALVTGQGVAVDGGGNVYVADVDNNAIRVFSPATQSLSTLPIGGLYFPESEAVDTVGNVYVVDTDNSRIEELPRAFVDPTPKTESSAAGNDSLPMVLPGSENLSAPFAPSSDSSWLTITGIANGIVSFAFGTNSGGDRTGHITVLGQVIPITQLTYIGLSASQRTEGPAGGTDSVFLTSLNNPWTATANAPWLHLSSGYQSGTTSTNVVFTFDANPGPTRVGTITIAGLTFTVVQEAVSLAASTRLEGPAAGMDSVLLQSVNTPWTATTNALWLHLSSGYQSGAGSTNVVFSFDANTGATRTGTLTIAGLTLNVTQAGSTYVAAPGPITLVSSNLDQPNGVAVDGAGNVYIADSRNNAVKEWLAAGNTVITLTTNGLNYPYSVAVDGAGNIYVDNESGSTLQEWSPASNTVTVLVTNGLNGPTGIAVDGVGNVYLADRDSYTIKEWSATASNVITLVSGLYYPQDVTVDFLGDVFIADTDHNAIKQWSVASGAVTTLVSSPGANLPLAIAADAGANLYFADQTAAVKEWSPISSNLTTLYASPSDPIYALALDDAGNLYFADNNYNVKELPHAFVDPTPKFESLAAGSDVLPMIVPATQNLLPPCAPTCDQPWLTITGVTNGVVSFTITAAATNRTANINLLGQNISVTQFSYLLNTNLLYVGPGSGSNSIGLMVNADVTQSWTASSQVPWLHLDATSGSGSATVGFTYDANPGGQRSGTLTIGGQTLVVVQEVLSLGTRERLEGPAAGADSVVLASFNSPWTATTNASWLHLSAANQSGTGSTNVVFSFDANTGATRAGTLTIAGLTVTITQAGSTYVAAPGPLTTLVVSSGVIYPADVAVDGAGNVYIADDNNYVIERWLLASNTVTTLVASGLSSPEGVAVDGAGNVYIADTYDNAIKEWSPANNTVITLVTNGLNYPYGVTVDATGNIYIADTGNNAIKEWSPANNTVVTLVSSGLNFPYGVAVDGAGNVYIADYDNNAIKKWNPANDVVTTLVGSGLSGPYGVAVDGAGNVYIADSGHNAIKEWLVASNTVTALVASGLSGPEGVAVDGVGNVYIADYNHEAVKELPRAFVDPTAKLESAAAGSDVLPGVLPATENLLAPFAPSTNQPWLSITGVTNGVVSFAFSANTGGVRLADITLLGKAIAVTQSTLPVLVNPMILTNGLFQFAFTNAPGGSYTVLSTTNLALPLSSWTPVGAPVENPPGNYVFTAPPATNSQSYYTVRSP